VREAISDAFPQAEICLCVVWLPMMETDNQETASAVVQNIPDARAQHFFDPEKYVGKAIATSLGSDGHVAWDTYAFYPPGIEWLDTPPAPVEWFFQQGNDDWADQSHLREDEALPAELTRVMQTMVTK
jgi:hypothetical protein